MAETFDGTVHKLEQILDAVFDRASHPQEAGLIQHTTGDVQR
ncbi:hypothetical protein [Amycolatopsis sp. NPDC051372]